jgi:hypothetical protein
MIARFKDETEDFRLSNHRSISDESFVNQLSAASVETKRGDAIDGDIVESSMSLSSRVVTGAILSTCLSSRKVESFSNSESSLVTSGRSCWKT